MTEQCQCDPCRCEPECACKGNPPASAWACGPACQYGEGCACGK